MGPAGAAKSKRPLSLDKIDDLAHIQVNGETITCTTEHPFYVRDKGWVGAEELKIGDKLELQNGANAFIEAVRHEKLAKPIQVYNFEVEDFHTYYVGSVCVLVHNVCAKSKGRSGKPDLDKWPMMTSCLLHCEVRLSAISMRLLAISGRRYACQKI